MPMKAALTQFLGQLAVALAVATGVAWTLFLFHVAHGCIERLP